MVLVASGNPQFFQPAEPPNADWHQNTESDRMSLCGAVAMRYNVDNVASHLPMNARFCLRCDAKSRGTSALIQQPEPKRKSRPANSRKKAATE